MSDADSSVKLPTWRTGARGDTSDDAELVVAFRVDGRNAAYGELVRRYQIPVFRMLLGLMAGGDDAETVCEDVFVKAARDIDLLEPPARFYPWVINRAQSRAAELFSPGGTMVAPPPSGPMRPDAPLRSAVQSALGSLSPEERAVLIFAELQQDSPEVIAETLGRSVDEVKELIRGAKRRFLSSLGSSNDSGAERVVHELAPGEVIDKRFAIVELIGEGGMGAVYRATHLGLGRDVALKIMQRASGPHEEELRERFKREALVLGRLEHDNLVDVTDFGELQDGTLYLSLELLDGESLGDHIAGKPLPPLDALRIARHILRGLVALHAEGVVHRDIKPENIIVVNQEGDPLFAKILDLGIAKLVTTSALSASEALKLTQTNLTVGTPTYIAPEQAAAGEVDARADLYSLTATLYEMLTGRPPFLARTMAMMMAKHISAPRPSLDSARPPFVPSDELENLIYKGMSVDPKERFQSAEAYLAEVERFIPPEHGGTGELTPHDDGR